jgi:hypothetical protein
MRRHRGAISRPDQAASLVAGRYPSAPFTYAIARGSRMCCWRRGHAHLQEGFKVAIAGPSPARVVEGPAQIIGAEGGSKAGGCESAEHKPRGRSLGASTGSLETLPYSR